MIKIIIIAFIIYLLVITHSRIRLPHPALQASVDVLQAANLKDSDVVRMASEFVRYSDSQNEVAQSGDHHAMRLASLTSKYTSVNGVRLNFRVYKTNDINAFATADGSIRVFSGLMDVMNDEELMAIVGHEMGHIRNCDSMNGMRKALLTSAARNILGSAGGALGALGGSELGSLAEKYMTAQFSQAQEMLADDFSFGFLIRNGYDPYSMARALAKIYRISQKGGSEADSIMQLFSTHPCSGERAVRMKHKAELYLKQKELATKNLSMSV